MDIFGSKIKIAGVILAIMAVTAYYFCLPDPLFRPAYASVLEARDGTLLGASIAPDGQWRFPLSDSVPARIREAILAFEDAHFYRHPGFNPFSLLRAARQNLEAGEIVSGGSTLSMQVIRLSRQGKARTIPEKLIEIILATRLELAYTKDEILALYAAHAPFGGNIVGLEAAAWRYYGRQAHQLSWGETATLAVLPNSPSLVYPGKNEERLLRKRNRLLDKLQGMGRIDSVSCQLAKLESLPGPPRPLPAEAPQLLTRIRQEGFAGRKVISSLDSQLQRQVNRIVDRHHQQLKGNGIHNAAVLVLDVESGQSLAYVGNTRPEKPTEHNASVDIVTAARSTGSILKPFLYAAMLHEGSLLPKELVPDIPTFIDGFAPKNFDQQYDGAVAADDALARSLNVPAVHMLQKYGVEKFHFLLQQMGMTTLDNPPSHYGLSLILGGAEATLWELGGMYASLARSMKHYFRYPEPLRYNRRDFFAPAYLKENVSPGEARLSENGLLNAGALWHTFEAMARVRRPENESGWENFDSSRKLAWKTGTSYGYRDAWAVGLTPQHVVAVWVGNADGEGRPGLTGLQAAAPLLFEVAALLPDTEWFDYPGSEMASVMISESSGMRASRFCDDTVRMDIPRSGLKSAACPYHQLVHLDEAKTYRVHSACAPLSEVYTTSWFVLPPVQEWYFRQHQPDYRQLPPLRPDCLSDEVQLALQLIYPRQNAQIYVPRELDGEKGQAIFEAAHRDPEAKIFWHLDDTFLGTTRQQHQMGLAPEPGRHRLTLVDQQGERLETYFTVLGPDSRESVN